MTSAFSEGWRVDVINVRTGQITYSAIPVTETPTFDRTLNQIGSIQVKIPLFVLPVADLRGYLSPWYSGLMVSYNNTPIQAGPVVSVTQDVNGRYVQVSAQGFWGILFKRPAIGTAYTYTEGVADPSVTANDLTFTNYSLAGIAQGLVQAATTRSGDGLPVIYPSITTSGTSNYTYRLFETTSTGQRLQEISQVLGGPDIDFQPVLSSTPGYMQWQMRTGQPFLTQQSGLSTYADYGAGLQSVTVDTNAANLTMGQFAKGSGTDVSTLISYSGNDTLTNVGWPRLYAVDTSHTSVLDYTTLYGWAQADLGLNQGTIETWTCILRADLTPALGTYVPGDSMSLSVAGHPWIPDGTYVQRILSVVNNDVATVKVTMLAATGKI